MFKRFLIAGLSFFFVIELIASDSTSSFAFQRQHEIWVCHEDGDILYEAETADGSVYLTTTPPYSEPDLQKAIEPQFAKIKGKWYEQFPSMQVYLLTKNQSVDQDANDVHPIVINSFKIELEEKAGKIFDNMGALEHKLLSRCKFLEDKLHALDTKVESLICYNELREKEMEDMRSNAVCCECKKRKIEDRCVESQKITELQQQLENSKS